MVNARSGAQVVSFDLDLESYFCTFSIQAKYLDWLNLATSFSVRGYIFRIYVVFEFQGHVHKTAAARIRGAEDTSPQHFG